MRAVVLKSGFLDLVGRQPLRAAEQRVLFAVAGEIAEDAAPINQTALASRLGVRRDQVSRALATLVRRRVLLRAGKAARSWQYCLNSSLVTVR